VRVFEKDRVLLTRAGFDNIGAQEQSAPDLPASVAGYENMTRRQFGVAKRFVQWLDTLPAGTRDNRGVVARKIGETPVKEWARIKEENGNVYLEYREPGSVAAELRLYAPHGPNDPSTYPRLIRYLEEMAARADQVTEGSTEHDVYALAQAAETASRAARPAPPTEPAPPAAAKPAPSVAIGKLAQHDALMDRLRDGTATLEEYRAGYEFVKANAADLRAELEKMTKAALAKRSGGRDADGKPSLVRQAYDQLLRGFILSRSFTYSPFGGGMQAAVEQMVSTATPETLTEWAEKVKEYRAERAERLKALTDAMSNPKTLDDFTQFVRVKGEAALTPEQRRQWEDLRAEFTRTQQEQMKERRATVQQVGQTVGAEIVETKHTQKGYDLFVVKLADRVERDIYNRLNAEAKRLGGYYSSFRGNGAVPGFQFKDRAAAEAFKALASEGDTEAATAAVLERREERAAEVEGNAVERLRAMADRIEGEGEGALEADRKVNTARRARMAAAAEAGARTQVQLARTMRRLADAIEGGEAKFLSGLRTKQQVIMLSQAINVAHSDRAREVTKGKSYDAFEREQAAPVTEETADFIKYPIYSMRSSDVESLAAQMRDVPGMMNLASRMRRGVEAVREERYLEALTKDAVLLSKMTLRMKDGGMAAFTNRQQAERAISRSNVDALVVKVGKLNHVVGGVARALEAKAWEDPDPSVQLTDDLGKAVAEKIAAYNVGKGWQRSINAGWWLGEVAERQRRLGAMGIVDNATYRAAAREFIKFRAESPEANRVRELERALAGRKDVGLDFFPTPAPLAERMAEALDVKPGMRVLEPSAGKGNLVDAVRELEPEAKIETVEQSGVLRDILEAKGYELVGYDFGNFTPREGFTYGDVFRAPDGKLGIMRGHPGGPWGGRVSLVDTEGRGMGYFDRDELEPVEKRGGGAAYDRVIMNPPFSNGLDADHVRRAYDMLNPGGRLVAITSEGIFYREDAKARGFRDWFAQVGGTSEKLEGAFLDPNEVRTTGVNTRMLVIDKPGEPAWQSASLRADMESARQIARGEARSMMEGALRAFDEGDRAGAADLVDRGMRVTGFDEFQKAAQGLSERINPPKQSRASGRWFTDNFEGGRGQVEYVDVPRTSIERYVYGGVRTRPLHGGERYLLPTDMVTRAQPLDDTSEDPVPGMIRLFRQEGAGARQRRGDGGTGMNRAAVRIAVEPVLGSWTNAPRVVVHDSPTDVDFNVAPDAAGAFYNGTVHLFAKNIRSASHAQFVILHETVGHFGLLGTLGQRLEPVMAHAYNTNPEVRALAAQWMQDNPRLPWQSEQAYIALAAEEALSDLAGSGLVREQGFWRWLVAAIRNALRSIGFDLDMSDSDVAVLLADAKRFVEGGGSQLVEGRLVPAASRDTAGPLWTSALEDAIAGGPASAPAAQWKAFITNLRTRGVKQDEIEWSGVTDWLETRPGKVDREAVLGFVRANGVQLAETILGGETGTAERDDLQVKLDAAGFDVTTDMDGALVSIEKRSTGDSYSYDGLNWTPEDPDAAQLPAEVQRMAQRFGELGENAINGEPTDGTKFGAYTLPGGDNYREVLLTLPNRTGKGWSGAVYFKSEAAVDDFLTDVSAMGLDHLEYAAVEDRRGARMTVEFEDVTQEHYEQLANIAGTWNGRIDKFESDDAPAFKSDHFREPNIVAHLRLKDRDDAQGRRILFVEEIQSDWAQKGKRRGFDDGSAAAAARAHDEAMKAREAAQREANAALREDDFLGFDSGNDALNAIFRTSDWRLSWPDHSQSTAEAVDRWITAMRDEEAKETILARTKAAIPSAPFVTKTEAWVALAVKRAIRMAVDGGYDGVSWTTGEQQADRYNLAKQVDTLSYVKREDGYRIDIIPVGRRSEWSNVGVYPEEKLAEVVGKDVADKIIRGEGELQRTGARYLSSLDLKVGGDGMVGFYDRIVPGVVRDVLKKVGGGKIETIDFANPYPRGGSMVKDPGGMWNVYAANGNLVGSSPYKNLAQGFLDKVNAGSGPFLQQPGFYLTPAIAGTARRGMPKFSRAVRQEGIPADAQHVATFRNTVALKAHPDYAAAKAGDDAAAVRLVNDLVPKRDLDRAREAFGEGVVYVWPHGEEASGRNRIPAMLAGRYAAGAGGELGHGIIQTNRAYHTGASAMERIIARPVFKGEVTPGARYVLVDDVSTMGSTLAELADHVLEGGGQVVGTVLLTDASRGAKITPDPARVQFLKERFGDVIRTELHVDPASLTAAEAGYLGNFRDADSLRNRVAAARRDRGARLRAQGLQPDEVAGEAKQSRSSAPLDIRTLAPQLAARLNDAVRTQRKFNWWHRTVGTQYAKAEASPLEYKPVFAAAQAFVQDTSLIATEAADRAPDILPRLESVTQAAKDLFNVKGVREHEADMKAVAVPVYRGTLEDNRVYTPEELRDTFKLTPRQIELYGQARESIDRSLDLLAASEMAQFASAYGLRRTIEVARRQPTLAQTFSTYRDALQSLARAATEGEQREIAKTVKAMENVLERADQLKREGYAPLMRFGKHFVYVWRPVRDSDGRMVRRTEYFALHDSERSANEDARRVKQLFEGEKGVTQEQGILSEESFKMFKGESPESFAIFAEALGLEQSEAAQAFYRMAVSQRSALKRLIHRKGTAGFTEDVSRTLATFITSNARMASRNYHMGEMKARVDDIKSGDVKDDAVALMEYLQDPQEEAAGFRGLLFIQYLGGSVASALVNATQSVTMTFPYLAQFVPAASAGKIITRAGLIAAGKETGSDELVAAMTRAREEGVTEPAEIHQLYAESIRGLGGNIFLRRFLKLWGSAFQLAEQFNRKTAFAAAFEVGQGMNAQQLMAAGVTSAYDFATKAVHETQGIYNRANRPNWARGVIGSTVFTFKQFSIAYLEFLTRLPPKQQALALAVLVLAAGIQGLPFAEDAEDLLDTIAESMGYNWQSEEAAHSFIANGLGLGSGVANWVLYGTSALPGVPLDIQARMGLGNLIPGTGLMRKSAGDKSREALEVFGPAGGLVKSALESVAAIQSGKFGSAFAKAAPVAAQNLMKAADMVDTGMYRDARDRKVVDVDLLDAAVKAIGFQPAVVASEQRVVGRGMQSISLARAVEAEIASSWAAAVFERDPARVQQARQRVVDWNEKNPETPINITPPQIMQRVRQMQLSRTQRALKSAPADLRPDVAKQLAGK
jgi:hypothetical protein